MSGAGRLDAGAERQKLAHTLGVDEAALSMLGDVPAEDVRALRIQAAEALFRADRHHFTRLAALTRAVPTALVARITEAALPPLVAARTAELLDPPKAAELVGRLSPRYLADVSAAMDASRAPEVVGAMPAATVASVGTELARRGEWVVMGAFVAHVSEPALRAAVAELSGDQLLRISFVLEDPARIDAIGAMLTERQLDEMLLAAADHGLWRELSELVVNLAPPRAARLGSRLPGLSAGTREQFAAAARDGALDATAWTALSDA